MYIYEREGKRPLYYTSPESIAISKLRVGQSFSVVIPERELREHSLVKLSPTRMRLRSAARSIKNSQDKSFIIKVTGVGYHRKVVIWRIR